MGFMCSVGWGRGDRECEAGADSVAGGYSEWITESCMVLISSLELSAFCHGAALVHAVGRSAAQSGRQWQRQQKTDGAEGKVSE